MPPPNQFHEFAFAAVCVQVHISFHHHRYKYKSYYPNLCEAQPGGDRLTGEAMPTGVVQPHVFDLRGGADRRPGVRQRGPVDMLTDGAPAGTWKHEHGFGEPRPLLE